MNTEREENRLFIKPEVEKQIRRFLWGSKVKDIQFYQKTIFKIQIWIKIKIFPKFRENKLPVARKFYIMFFKEFYKDFQNN